MKNNKVKVLTIGSDSSVKGGITTVINSFLNYKFEDIELELLPTYIETNNFKKITFFFKSLIVYIKKNIKNDFDIAHIHMSYKGSFIRKYLIFLITKLFKKKVILHLHGSEFEVFYKNSNFILKKMIKDILKKSDLVIVLGEKWKNVIQEIEPSANVKIFNNSVPVPKYKVGLNDNGFNILFLGVLIKRKGIYDLIEAIKILNDSGVLEKYNVKFTIGGSGKEKEEIENKISDYNLDSVIDMVGWVDGELKESLLKNSQLFVLPSYNEGLPMAILEAMSYGIPVISTEVGSIGEVVCNYKTGFTFKPGDINSLVQYIEKLITEKQLWYEMSGNCKKSIEEDFNEEKYFYKVEKEYKKLIEKEY